MKRAPSMADASPQDRLESASHSLPEVLGFAPGSALSTTLIPNGVFERAQNAAAAPSAPRIRPGDAELLAEATAILRVRLHSVATLCQSEGMPECPLDGQLLRPLVALSMVPDATRDDPDHPFWSAVLAVQMAHEASLLHDDIIDDASARRGRPTMYAAHGIGRALVHGDHLLATGYHLAARTGSPRFTAMFARAIERTIAGEVEQGRLRGQRIDRQRCLEIAEGKSGELIGCAIAASECLSGGADVDRIQAIGRGVGRLYQMLDDLLDYCPSTDTGKPALTDYAQERWTWVLAEAPSIGFGLPAVDIARLLHGFGATDEAGSPAATGSVQDSTMRRCLEQMRQIADQLLEDAATLREGEAPALLRALLNGWMERAETAVSLEEVGLMRKTAGAGACRAAIRAELPEAGSAKAHLAANSRSFSFASRWLPSADREKIARVYAFCRVTDDLVDGAVMRGFSGAPGDPAAPDAADILDEWEALARRAYEGERTGIHLVDEVMREMALAEVPFHYAGELIEGMRMDLRSARYATFAELEGYTFRVASVVGMWIAELAGVRDSYALERAAGLGHAMQLTNILRDVGEDLRMGRLYLPADLLARNALSEDDLRDMLDGRAPIDHRYRAAVEQVMELAEHEYRRSFAALPCLPSGMQKAFAAAAGIYRGIHEEIRRNRYDNFSLRAHTSVTRKAVLAARAMRELAAARSARRAIQEAH